MLTTVPNDCPVNTAVALLRLPLSPPVVVVEARPGQFPLDGDALVPVWFYGLGWPDGTTTWHLRHEFQPILNERQVRR